MARPKRDEQAFEAAAAMVRAAREADRQQLAYTTPFLASACLPVSDPGNIPVYERRNGDTELNIRQGYAKDPETGETRSLGYPSGVFARKTMLYTITEARRTRRREITLGDGITDFQRKISPGGAISGGPTGSLTRLRTQSEQLFNAAISIRVDRMNANDDDEPATYIKNLTVADEAVLWGNDKKGSGRAVVVLAPTFFNEILEKAVPLDWNALHAFGDDPTCIDMYIFFTYRFHSLKRPITISLDDWNEQFGLYSKIETKEARYKARQGYTKRLARVLKVYDDANVEMTKAGIVMRPSLTHVPLKGMRAVQASLGTQLTLGA